MKRILLFVFLFLVQAKLICKVCWQFANLNFQPFNGIIYSGTHSNNSYALDLKRGNFGVSWTCVKRPKYCHWTGWHCDWRPNPHICDGHAWKISNNPYAGTNLYDDKCQALYPEGIAGLHTNTFTDKEIVKIGETFYQYCSELGGLVSKPILSPQEITKYGLTEEQAFTASQLKNAITVDRDSLGIYGTLAPARADS